MYEQRRPGRCQTGQPHTLSQSCCRRALPSVARMVLVAHIWRVADYGIHFGKGTPQLVGCGEGEEICGCQAGVETVGLELPPGLVQRAGMKIDAEESFVELIGRATGRTQMPAGGQQKYGLAAGGIEDTGVGIFTNRPSRQMLSYGLGRKERASILA